MPLALHHLDFGLREAIKPLVEGGQFDSAIRKALVLLKTRVTERLKISREIDGEKLVNHVFGSNSTLLPSLTSSEKQAYRDLFAGMYGLLRNRYMHNDVRPDYLEVDVILANVNLFLRLIGDFHRNALDVLLVEPDERILELLLTQIDKVDVRVRGVPSIKRASEIVELCGPPTVLVLCPSVMRGDVSPGFKRNIIDNDRIPKIVTSDFEEFPIGPLDARVNKPFLLEDFLDAVGNAIQRSFRPV